MGSYPLAFAQVIALEGGYANHQDDRGGETYRGISRRLHPTWPGWKIIDRNKTNPLFPKLLDTIQELQEWVRQFYLHEFWNPLRLDDIPQSVAIELFEQAVNVGLSRSTRWLQRGLNALSRNQRLYGRLAVDGVLGARTIAAVNQLPTADLHNLAKILNVLQGAHYVQLVEMLPSQEAFLRGWLSRVEITSHEVSSEPPRH